MGAPSRRSDACCALNYRCFERRPSVASGRERVRDFRLDLLFYHRELQSLITIELKVDEFKPEYLGKLGFSFGECAELYSV